MRFRIKPPSPQAKSEHDTRPRGFSRSQIEQVRDAQRRVLDEQPLLCRIHRGRVVYLNPISGWNDLKTNKYLGVLKFDYQQQQERSCVCE